jgi:hypothetical protein
VPRVHTPVRLWRGQVWQHALCCKRCPPVCAASLLAIQDENKKHALCCGRCLERGGGGKVLHALCSWVQCKVRCCGSGGRRAAVAVVVAIGTSDPVGVNWGVPCYLGWLLHGQPASLRFPLDQWSRVCLQSSSAAAW